MLPQPVCSAPANKEFVEGVAEIVCGIFEIRYERAYGQEYDPGAPALVGNFRYRPGAIYNELTVYEDDIFRWSNFGQLLSAPLKTEQEWINWLNSL